MLHHAVERNQVAIYVIDDFDWRRRWPEEIERRPATKYFDVRGEERNKTIS